jgi:cysteine desulfurase
MPMIYLDNNSTSPVLPDVLEAMLPCFTESFRNPSSIHGCGRRALGYVKDARQQVAALLGCLPAEVVFTTGGTEGDNLALKGMLNRGDHLIVSAIEHSAILSTCTWLEKQGCEVTRVGVNSHGQVEPGDVKAALRKNTRLISVMMANNETGVLQPVDEIGRIAAEADVWFHTDQSRLPGKCRLRWRRSDATCSPSPRTSFMGRKERGPCLCAVERHFARSCTADIRRGDGGRGPKM